MLKSVGSSGGAGGGASLGANTFTAAQTIASTEPRLIFNETDQGADLKLWDLDLASGVFTLRTRTDADGAGVTAIAVTRGATTAISNVSFGNATNNPTYTFLGTGTTTFGGAIAAGANSVTTTGRMTAGQLNVTDSSTASLPSGLVRPGTNRLGFVSNNTLRGEFDANGQFILSTVGRGISVAEGSNAKMGVATLVGGTVVVSTTAVTANSRALLTCQSLGTVAVPSGYGVSARTAGTSFTILASAPTDTSVIAWMLVEPS